MKAKDLYFKEDDQYVKRVVIGFDGKKFIIGILHKDKLFENRPFSEFKITCFTRGQLLYFLRKLRIGFSELYYYVFVETLYSQGVLIGNGAQIEQLF